MKKILLNLCMVLLISGCVKPTPTFFKAPTGGGAIYQKAWHDGCESGFSAYGNDYWRSFYHYKSDVKMMTENKVYSRVWWDSFNYCRHYLNRYQMDGFWGNEGFGEGDEANFNQGLRNPKVIEQKGFSIPLWEGLNTPGWGEHTWGGDVASDGDWLGRHGDDKADWLGRKNGGW